MMLAWIAVALLSVSWLLGLNYYHQANWPAWCAVVFAGTALLTVLGGGTTRGLSRFSRRKKGTVPLADQRTSFGMPPRRESALALGMTIPAALLIPWPYRAAPLLLAAGLGLHVLPYLRHCPRRISLGTTVAGCVLLVQSLAVLVYAAITSRSHELTVPLAQLLGAVFRLLGIDVAVSGSTLVTHSMRTQHYLGATWELLLDPVTVCFTAGGIVLLLWRYRADPSPEKRAWRPAGEIGVLLLLLLLWAPLRGGLLTAIYLHDVLRTDYDAPLDAMKLFWNPWLLCSLLAVPVLAAWRFLPWKEPGGSGSPIAEEPPLTDAGKWQLISAAGLALAGVALLTAAVSWDPVGRRMEGRVIVEEYNPQPDKIWEPTNKPFDTEWYGHLSGYNYYCIYDYCSRYYSTSRLTAPIDAEALKDCDVLVIKVPTRPYSDAEIDTILRFVESGGGLLLIGEHTNVFGTGTYLNAIAREFGFSFRYDCLFGVDSVFEQLYQPPLVPHPVVQHMPPMHFATSCSIDPGKSSGRAVIRSTGLKNVTADYHVSNFYPVPDDRADMRYGAFVQLWSTRYGRGRVLAFTDSTIFSNFATFEPGKPELMLGMLEWLNHRSRISNPRPWLAAGGLLSLLCGLVLARKWYGGWMVLTGSGLLGFSLAAVGLMAAHRMAMPAPAAVRPMVQVVMDQTVSEVPLPKNGFIGGKEKQFGIFERWILRLGYFTSRRQGSDVFAGDPNLIVFLYPSKKPGSRFLGKLAEYVAAGGKVLVIDSPENKKEIEKEKEDERSTANELLEPFDISIDRTVEESGQLKTSNEWPSVAIEEAHAVEGGRPLAWLNGKPVAAVLTHNEGSVTVIGFGSRLTDANMGITGDVIPTDDLRELFELEFSLLRDIVGPQ